MVSIFKTKLGWVGMRGGPAGISRIILPRRRRVDVLNLVGGEEVNSPKDKELSQTGFTERDMESAKRDMLAYLSGERVSFNYPLDLQDLSPFALKVLKIVGAIPHGETRSYSWVAEKLGDRQLSRAVGQALARNPVPIVIPCHRVIMADGKIGGFAGKPLLKKILLEIEESG